MTSATQYRYTNL